jgi:hypothetical protein
MRSPPRLAVRFPLTTVGRPWCGKCSYRSFVAVLISTGGRPKHVRQAPFHLLNGCFVVKWMARKVRGPMRSSLAYPMCWSAVHFPDILVFLQGDFPKKWDEVGLPGPDRIAGSVTAWMTRRATVIGVKGDCTSTSGRTLMSMKLAAMVKEKKMDERLFCDLMDHDLETSHYVYSPSLVR